MNTGSRNRLPRSIKPREQELFRPTCSKRWTPAGEPPTIRRCLTIQISSSPASLATASRKPDRWPRRDIPTGFSVPPATGRGSRFCISTATRFPTQNEGAKSVPVSISKPATSVRQSTLYLWGSSDICSVQLTHPVNVEQTGQLP
jgi:hypothetical protein